ncbi:Ig-like domain-containing protein [Sphingomonas sp. PB4P5]|uniref:Ig-like domain-containing protein n=1 Tax=Parasphingomonas puruogangriensis TaxID=3096155 RepID=UPI003FA72906
MRSKSKVLLAVGISTAIPCYSKINAQEITGYSYDALGRLIGSSIAGGGNNSVNTKACFDSAGNRTQYKVSIGGALTCPPPASPPPSPTPTPTPTPSPANQPPVAVNDATTIACYYQASVNLVYNDSDPDGNIPLTIISITRTSGTAVATVASASNVLVTTAAIGKSIFSYTVSDGLGAIATGQLSASSVKGTNCPTGPGTDIVITPES